MTHLILNGKKLKWLPLKMWHKGADAYHFYSTQDWRALPVHLVKKKKRQQSLCTAISVTGPTLDAFNSFLKDEVT